MTIVRVLAILTLLLPACADILDVRDPTSVLEVEGCCALANVEDIPACARDAQPDACETHDRVELTCSLRGLRWADICSVE